MVDCRGVGHVFWGYSWVSLNLSGRCGVSYHRQGCRHMKVRMVTGGEWGRHGGLRVLPLWTGVVKEWIEGIM